MLPFFDDEIFYDGELYQSYCEVEDPETGEDIATYYTRAQCEQAFQNGYRVVFYYLNDLLGPYTDVQMEVNICEGADVPEEDCNDASDDTVFHGGVDDFNLFDLDLEIDLATGDYTLCYIGTASYLYDNSEGTTITEYIDFGPICENFTIETEEETRLLNFTDDRLAGTLDVYIGDSFTNPLNNIRVELYQDGNLIDWTCSDINGEAQFPTLAVQGVYEDTYTVVATDSGLGCADNDYYETQNGMIIYDVFEDWAKAPDGGLPDLIVDDDLSQWGAFYGIGTGDGTPDLILLLSPDTALDILTTVDDVPIPGVEVSVYLADPLLDNTDDTDLIPDTCGGTFVNSGFTDANGEVEFGVIPGDYCAIADPNGDGIVDAETGTVIAADTDGDIDITIDEDNVVGVQTLIGGAQVAMRSPASAPRRSTSITVNVYDDADLLDDGVCTPGVLIVSRGDEQPERLRHRRASSRSWCRMRSALVHLGRHQW